MGSKDELNKAKVNIAGVEGEFTEAEVKGTLKDEVVAVESSLSEIGLEKRNKMVIPNSERLCGVEAVFWAQLC